MKLADTPRFNGRHIKPVAIIGMVLSVLGIADSTYLTIAHYTSSVTLACPATAFINCQKVTTSSYSTIHGIPLTLLGLAFFCSMFVLQLPISWSLDNAKLRLARLIFSIIGLLSVFYLVYVELFELDSICLYCTGVHILTFGLFVITVLGSATIGQNDSRLRHDDKQIVLDK
jgi:uncharacterized membrane protein